MRSPYPVTEWRCGCGETWEAVVHWPCRRCGAMPTVVGPAWPERTSGCPDATEDLRGFRPDERWAVRAYGE